MKRTVLAVALALCVIAPQIASAEADLGFKRIGLATGYVSPEDFDGTFSIGAFADWGTLAPRFGLETRIDYWSKSEEPFPGVEVSVRDIAVGGRGKYFFEVKNPTIRPFVGTGLALHFLSAEAQVIPGVTVEDSSTKLGLDLGGGIATSINPRADFLAELWYGIVSDVNQLSLRAAVSFAVGS
jgi:hypothetical protein